jgi:hypothetical protein
MMNSTARLLVARTGDYAEPPLCGGGVTQGRKLRIRPLRAGAAMNGSIDMDARVSGGWGPAFASIADI